MLSGLLVDISLGVVAGLVELVSESILSGGGAAGEGCIAVLGDRLGIELVFCSIFAIVVE